MSAPSVDPRPRFQQLQYAFTAHIRDPAGQPAPSEVDSQRMAVYRRLVYSNIQGYLATAYPVLRSLYDNDGWHQMVRDFFVSHRCHKPQFYQVAEEFLHYLEDERGQVEGDPPCLLELACYEWLELMLYIADEPVDLEGVDRDGELLTGVPVVSPLVRRLVCRYPVHAIDPEDPPSEPPAEPTHLLVYRDLGGQEQVHFLKINAVTARLLELLEGQSARSGREQLETLAGELGQADPEPIIAHGAQILADLRARDILLGARPVHTTGAVSALPLDAPYEDLRMDPNFAPPVTGPISTRSTS